MMCDVQVVVVVVVVVVLLLLLLTTNTFATEPSRTATGSAFVPSPCLPVQVFSLCIQCGRLRYLSTGDFTPVAPDRAHVRAILQVVVMAVLMVMMVVLMMVMMMVVAVAMTMMI